MKRLLLILSLLIFTIQADACSCMGMNLPYAFFKADVVIVGKAINDGFCIHYGDTVDGRVRVIPHARATVVISQIYKGAIFEDTVEVASTGTSCDYPLMPNREYIIFAWYGTPPKGETGVKYQQLYTNMCSGSQPQNRKAVKKIEKIAAG